MQSSADKAQDNLEQFVSQFLILADEYYGRGKFDKCVDILEQLEEKIKIKSFPEASAINKHVFFSLMENNILVFKVLLGNSNILDDFEKWSDYLDKFFKLHEEIKYFQLVYKVPLKIYLNIAHNTLWLCWWHPKGLKHDESHVEMCMQVAIDCFKKVLDTLGDSYTSSSFCENENTLLHIMERASKNLHRFSGEETVQLLEIYLITICILIESKPKMEIVAGSITVFSYILDFRDTMLSNLKLLNKTDESSVWSKCFKFGLCELNGTTGSSDIESVLEILNVTCCMCLLWMKQHGKCVEYLNRFENYNEKLQSIQLYMKAYACYQKNELEGCSFNLSKLEHTSSSTNIRVWYHILQGSLLAKLGRHCNALIEFFKPLSIELEDTQEKKDFYPIILYYIAMEYEALYFMYESCSSHNLDNKLLLEQNYRNKKNTSSKTAVSLYSSLKADYLDTLQHLVQVLKDEDKSKVKSRSFNLEQRILHILHPQPEINLAIALYKLATASAEEGDISVAGKLYIELLTQSDLHPHQSLVTQLPHVSILYHNAITLMLRNNELQEVELLCKKAICCYSSSYNSKDLAHSLLNMEDDLVTLMLLAKLHKLKGDDTQESETLDRCIIIINNYKKSKCTIPKETNMDVDSNGPDTMKIINLLEAKLHLQKAMNYLQRGHAFKADCFCEFRQALLCNSGDKEVNDLYKVFLENNDYYGHEGIPVKANTDISVNDCSSIALKYLLQSYTSVENDMDLL